MKVKWGGNVSEECTEGLLWQHDPGSHCFCVRIHMCLRSDNAIFAGVGIDNNGVLVLGATNIPWTLDSAIRRRYLWLSKWKFSPVSNICVDRALLTLTQIWKENLHSTARGARPVHHVQAPPGLHAQQSLRERLHNPGQENRWILRGRYQHHCQRCSHAACSQGPVSNTLQAGGLSLK